MLFIWKFIKLSLRKNKIQVLILLIILLMSIDFVNKKNWENILSDFNINININESTNSIITSSTVQSKLTNESKLIEPKYYVCPANEIPSNTDIYGERKLSKRSWKDFVIMTSDSSIDLQSDLANLLHSTKIKYVKKNNSELISTQTSIILFQNYDHYQMEIKNLNFTNFLLKNKIGVIVFNIGTENIEKVDILRCKLNENVFLKDFLYTTKNNTQYFNINRVLNLNRAFKNLKIENSKLILQCETSSNTFEDILFVNKINGIKHVFINTDNLENIWLLKSLFIDALRYSSNGAIEISLDRYVQIDIDDIFVAKPGTRMISNDVHELIRLQDELSSRYFYRDEYKFKFNIGYSGYYYQFGDELEDAADRLLIGKTTFNYFYFLYH